MNDILKRLYTPSQLQGIDMSKIPQSHAQRITPPLRPVRTRSATVSNELSKSTSCKIIQNPEWDTLLEEKRDIVYNDDDLIKGGSVDSIIAEITNPKFSSQNCLNAFLLTYRAFATPMELLRLLISRFHVPNISHPDPAFQKYFEERKRKPIQLRYEEYNVSLIRHQ